MPPPTLNYEEPVYAQALRVSLPYPQGTDWGSTRIAHERSVDGDGPTRGPTKE